MFTLVKKLSLTTLVDHVQGYDSLLMILKLKQEYETEHQLISECQRSDDKIQDESHLVPVLECTGMLEVCLWRYRYASLSLNLLKQLFL